VSRTQDLISAEQLAALLDRDGSVCLLDVRWRLSDSSGEGRIRYGQGHLPSARFLDLEAVLTGHTGNPLHGRHPLPDGVTLEAGLGALGVRSDDDLVVYDEPGSFAAERAWWVLAWAGLRVRLLDGGIPAWVASGGELQTGEPTPVEPTMLHLVTGQLPTIHADAAAKLAVSGVLVDGRSVERYRGEVEPLDPRPGHIPGAVNVPATELYTDDGRLPSEGILRDRLGAAGGGLLPVAAYCGSGVSAARDVLALRTLGVDAALFPGSWSAWSNDPDRPAALGSRA
jgi:thiosulfate/3-mercaptopyruvate sulfurtransferase